MYPKILGLWLISLAAGFSTLRALPITFGQDLPGPDNAAFFGGTSVAAQTTPVTTPTFTGTARSAVYRNAAGTLDFYYQFTNAGPASIGRLSFFNFDAFTTNVFNITNGSAIGSGFIDGTVDSISVDRSLDPTFNTVGFDYMAGPSGFIPGTTSLAVAIRTNATNFAPGTFSVINGSTSTTGTFAPAVAVGVPDHGSSAALLALSVLALLGFSRRRRQLAARTG